MDALFSRHLGEHKRRT